MRFFAAVSEPKTQLTEFVIEQRTPVARLGDRGQIINLPGGEDLLLTFQNINGT